MMKTMMVVSFIFSFAFAWMTTPHEARMVPAAGPAPAPVEAFSVSTKGPFKNNQTLPIDTTFKLPAPIPVWPPGNGFGSGIINLGGLQVAQISTFNKIWSSYEGGPDNVGATVFEPSGIPEGFSMLGCYSQPNNKPLFGQVLVAKDDSPTSNNPALKEPLDYTLIWTSESLEINQNGSAYFWLPTPPNGYVAVGHVVTASPDKPSLDKIRCVRSDLTDQLEAGSSIWENKGFNIYNTRPTKRGTQALTLVLGTFIAQNGGSNGPLFMFCLRNTNPNSTTTSMPNLQQIDAIVQAYSPIMYLHPDEEYLPSSVNWFFSNGGLLYKKGDESNPSPIQPNGNNLPQDPNNDDSYWLDLPADETNRERVKKGELQSAQAYLHIKPMFGGTYTDIAMWVYYPFNGPARAKIEFFNIPLGKIGEHVGDWEHVTLRVSNFNGELQRVYFSEHSGGKWVDSSDLEFKSGNKFASYASLHGHAFYSKPGLVLRTGNYNNNGIGIRNDTESSDKAVDLGVGFEVVSAEYLGPGIVVEPPWLNYYREWGPKITYDIANELKKVEKFLTGKLKKLFEKFVSKLPSELLGEEGPTGPKVKNSWSGDEI
ncbi:DUF946 family protein [Senna tora]|uniref:DUF946 family protein n=1 Tax=Senna tora TaxID=362788 RepID=A0A834X0U6_9FABA|nr:DUF946 family protein [Senna tora]